MNKTKNYIVFDFETGGVDPRKNAACEIACIIVDGTTLEFKGSYQSLIKPFSEELTYEPGAIKVTGITKEMCESQGKPIIQVVDELCEFFLKAVTHKGPKYLPILVGHNVLFDIGFLSQIFLFCKKDLSKYISSTKDIYGTPSFSSIDTMEDTARTYGHDLQLLNWKLETICNFVGIELNDAHRAMNDTLSTAELFRFFTRKMRSSGNKGIDESNSDNSRFRAKFQIKTVS